MRLKCSVACSVLLNLLIFCQKDLLVHIDSTHKLFVITGFHYEDIRTTICTFGRFIDGHVFWTGTDTVTYTVTVYSVAQQWFAVVQHLCVE